MSPDTLGAFPVISCSGSRSEIGHTHGKVAARRIAAALDYYRGLFASKGIAEAELGPQCREFRHEIEAFSTDFYQEIVGISDGARVSIEDIVLLNARTEIWRRITGGMPLGTDASANECTTAVMPKGSILGENWDWDRALEPLCVVLEVQPEDKPSFICVSEPGILCKFGLNDQGLGLGLNILRTPAPIGGVPAHILLRDIIESPDIDAALDRLGRAKRGTMSCFTIAQAKVDGGTDSCLVELAGDVMEVIGRQADGPIHHTNHYLGCGLKDTKTGSPSSYSRYARAAEVLPALPSSVEGMKTLLRDAAHTDLPICRAYETDADGQDIGTVCSVVMDLKNRQLHLTPGSPLENDYRTHLLA